MSADSSSLVNVSPSQCAELLTLCVNVGIPAFVWGEPGIGKSDVAKQALTLAGYEYLDVRAILLDPVDLRGFPYLVETDRGKVQMWAEPGFLPKSGCVPTGIFLDELNRAPVLVQNACFQLILDRRLGEYELPDNCVILAAGNRESDGGGITRMPSALANRFVHFYMETSLDDWSAWAVGSGDAIGTPNPGNVTRITPEAGASRIRPEIIAFHRFKPGLLHLFDRNAHAFPTPRSWSMVSRLLDASGGRVSGESELALYAGAVGQGAAIEFLAFLRLYRNLPNIDALLLDPANAPVPTDVGTLYAVTAALASRANVSNFGRVLAYLSRVPAEYSVFTVKDALARDEGLAQTPDFTSWAVSHAHLF